MNELSIKPHARVTGENRVNVTRELVARYNKGASVRTLARDTGRSYGFIHRLLVEAGVTMRSRGGATRKPGSAPRKK